MRPLYPWLASCIACFVAVSLFGCSASNEPSVMGPGPSAGGSLSNGGNAAAGSAGTLATAGVSSGGGGAGTAGVGTGGSGNTAGAAVGGSSGAAGNAAGGMSGAAGGTYVGPTGMSAGCNKLPPANDSVGSFALHELHIQASISPNYLAGGDSYDQSGKYDYQFRPYSVRLPTGYDSTKPYAVIFGGGGCGGNAQDFSTNPGAGYDIDKMREVIFVGLAYVAGCFSDGGGGTKNRPDSPEPAYVHEVLAEIEGNYCIDKSRVFLTGHSSGGWESFTVGCALADEIRGIAPVSGGLRNHRPACTGPQASIMVEGLGDTSNPIGPLDPPKDSLDSGGSAPARDEILKRNGCVPSDFQFMYMSDNTKEAKAGNAPHTMWDAAFPSCYQYTGCPAEYPVVWCALDGGHEVDKEGDVDYKLAMMKFFGGLASK